MTLGPEPSESPHMRPAVLSHVKRITMSLPSQLDILGERLA